VENYVKKESNERENEGERQRKKKEITKN